MLLTSAPADWRSPAVGFTRPMPSAVSDLAYRARYFREHPQGYELDPCDPVDGPVPPGQRARPASARGLASLRRGVLPQPFDLSRAPRHACACWRRSTGCWRPMACSSSAMPTGLTWPARRRDSRRSATRLALPIAGRPAATDALPQFIVRLESPGRCAARSLQTVRLRDTPIVPRGWCAAMRRAAARSA